jgi:hypothetical protein
MYVVRRARDAVSIWWAGVEQYNAHQMVCLMQSRVAAAAAAAPLYTRAPKSEDEHHTDPPRPPRITNTSICRLSHNGPTLNSSRAFQDWRRSAA